MGWTYEKRQGILLFLTVSYATAFELKQSMDEANHSSPSNAEIKNRHIYIYIYPCPSFKSLCCGAQLYKEILTIFVFHASEKTMKVKYNLDD